MILNVNLCIFATIFYQEVMGISPKFRILAPEFICPIDVNAPVQKPDNTVITIQTAAGANFDLTWTVRWTPLPKPSQRFTIMLWKAVRALEAKLNKAQPMPYVYVIENNELLHGVDYVFTVNAVESAGEMETSKTFRIDNSQGDQKLDLIEGRADMLSIMLVGGELARVNAEYVLEAQVTSCFETQDYYFKWTVVSTESDNYVDVSHITGSRLEVPPYLLKPGCNYDAKCEVIKLSNGLGITETGLHFQTLNQAIELYLSIDYLMVTINHAFVLETIVLNHDYHDHPVMFQWNCTYEGNECENFENTYNDSLLFPIGLQNIGRYAVTVSVSVFNQSTSASATIVTVEPILPVLKISPLVRALNEGSTVYLVANASNVVPTCTLTWYFAAEESSGSLSSVNKNCDDCQHGEPLSETLTIFSLQENFLTELTDFTNETEWRQITTEMPATAGRARFVAECGCSLTFDCETKGIVHADLSFQLNKSPKPGEIMVSPESGTALETVFRISTVSVVDPDVPLQYSFYCRIGDNETLLLASYLEHLSVETLLPYTDGGTEIWVVVCDGRGACSSSESKMAQLVLSAGQNDTIKALIKVARAHARRCELIALRRVVVSAVVTYNRAAGQTDGLIKFSNAVIESLESIESTCVDNNYEQYLALLHWMTNAGVGTGSLID